MFLFQQAVNLVRFRPQVLRHSQVIVPMSIPFSETLPCRTGLCHVCPCQGLVGPHVQLEGEPVTGVFPSAILSTTVPTLPGTPFPSALAREIGSCGGRAALCDQDHPHWKRGEKTMGVPFPQSSDQKERFFS